MTKKNPVARLHVKRSLVEKLNVSLADTYALYLKTQNFHWNVEGPNFHSLHELFEQQYQDLAEAADKIAERIRALGHKAPATFAKFSRITHIEEGDGAASAETMLSMLYEDQQIMVKALKDTLHQAQQDGDEATADLMIQRITTHEKNAWMLKASMG